MNSLPDESAMRPTPSRTDRPAILLVDDDDALRRQLSALLTNSGYRVRHAGDHRRALAIIESGGPLDLLMTDLVIPRGVGGMTLARMARVRRPSLKIVYITGYDVPADQRDADVPILRKPLAPGPLLAAIHALLQ